MKTSQNLTSMLDKTQYDLEIENVKYFKNILSNGIPELQQEQIQKQNEPQITQMLQPEPIITKNNKPLIVVGTNNILKNQPLTKPIISNVNVILEFSFKVKLKYIQKIRLNGEILAVKYRYYLSM